MELEVQPGGAGVEPEAADRHPVQDQFGERRRLHLEEHLEERVAAEVAHRAQLLDQLLEGHVLVRVGGEGRLPHAGEQLAEGRIPGEVRAQRHAVDEQPDQSLELTPAAAGHGQADHHVVLSRVPVEQAHERGQHRHEGRRAFAPTQLADAAMGVGPEAARVHGAPRGPDVGARTVGRELQLRRALELPLPVFRLRPYLLALQPLPLPGGVVRVLDGQLGDGRGVAGGERGVVRAHLAEEQSHRPPVGGDVVQREEQHVVALTQPEQPCPQEGTGGEVERRTRLLVRPAPRLRLPRVRVELAQVLDGKSDRGRGEDHLPRLALHRREGRAERLVPAHDRFQAPAKGRRVEGTGKPKRVGEDVGGTGFELVQEPQALLGEGQGQGAVAGHANERYRLRGRAAADGLGGFEVARELAGGGALEDCAQGNVDPEVHRDPVPHLDGHQRIEPEVGQRTPHVHAGLAAGIEAEHPRHLSADVGQLRARPIQHDARRVRPA